MGRAALTRNGLVSSPALRGAALLLALLSAAGCGDSGPPPVGAIVLLTGALQAEVGAQVAVRVRVDDRDGLPIEGIRVTFTADGGAGSAAPTSAPTDAAGTAEARWTLGTVAGVQALLVGSGEATLRVTATAAPGPPEEIVASAGDAQTGQVGIDLPEALVARVRDRFANGVPAIEVFFKPQTGSVPRASGFTGEDGRVAMPWALGGSLGTQRLTASFDTGLRSASIDFTATGIPGPPESFALASGADQTGVVGEALAQPIVFVVRDRFGNAAVGAEIVFVGDGSADPATAAVDVDGRVSTVWTLGTVAGPQTLAATAGSQGGTVGATALAGPPAAIAVLSGDAQVSYATATLVEPVVVRVDDAFGNPVPGATVLFSATAGGGSAAPSSVESQSDGTAATRWTLGGLVGEQALQAVAGSAPAASVGATAVSGPPSVLAAVSGDGQSATVGTTLAEEVVVAVRDAAGRPVPGVVVDFDPGAGSVSSGSPVTPLDGTARTTWTLGTVAGAQFLEAVVDGLTPLSVRAVAGPGPAASLTRAAGEGQSAVISTAVAMPPAVRVADDYGNAVPGVEVLFEAEAGSGSITGPTPTTGADGVAAVGSWTLSGTVGPHTLFASVAGLSTITFTAHAVLPSLYDVVVRYQGTPPPPSQQAAFVAAAARWEQIIVADLPAVPVSLPAGSCGLPAIDETVDDVLIFVEVVPIDGEGAVLGSASPCWVRSAGGLTIVGSMRIDAADADALEASGRLEAVVLHEMGHVLGFGTISPWYDTLVGEGGSNPYFPGAQSVARYAAAGGSAALPVPIENSGGAGTRDAHWREANLGSEAMTGYLNPGANPMSAITIGAMADMGYTVDYSVAEAYTVPPGGALRIGGAVVRIHDVVGRPVGTIDPSGRANPVRR